MFENFFISKREVAKLKITPKNPLTLTCEKITHSPRLINTTQIKTATENLSLIDIEEIILPDLVHNTIDYILKGFFIYMHQTGLYNRQLKLWKALGNTAQVTVLKLEKGVFSKKELNAKIINLFTTPNSPCISAIIDESDNQNNFKLYLSQALSKVNINRLRGILYFFRGIPTKDFITKLNLITSSGDPILKYESTFLNHMDVRLNVINYQENNGEYIFNPIYPELKSSPKEILRIKNEQY